MFELAIILIGGLLLISNTVILSIVAEERMIKKQDEKLFLKD